MNATIAQIVAGTWLLGMNAVCQPSAFPTNLLYFKTNMVNDLTNLEAADKAYRQGKIGKDEMIAVTLATLNDEPIVFYGQVEDQVGNAITNALINFDVRVYNGVESTVNRGQVRSGDKGLFVISGYQGESLNVVPHKDGYALWSSCGHVKYSRLEEGFHVPDPAHPVVIKMWKIQGAEPLVGVDKEYKLHYTNAPICFDLLSKRIVPDGGDIRITVNRPPGIHSGRNPLTWSVILEVPSGGLVDSSGTERMAYFAPESGYQPRKFLSPATGLPEGGTDGFHGGYYLKSRDGRVFTKFGLSFRINEMPEDYMYISFSGVANTNSSRNWEGAPGTFLNPGF